MDVTFKNFSGESFTFGNELTMIVCMLLIAMAMGLIVSLVNMYAHREEGHETSLTLTIILLPAITAMIIMLVGSNTAQALSLAGAATLIRFRTTLGSPKDLAYVFFSLAIGLACGSGFIGYAALFTVIVSVVMLILELTGFGTGKGSHSIRVKITIPEDINYPGTFDSIMDDCTKKWTLCRVKSVDFGSLCELEYTAVLKQGTEPRELIDRVRAKNGNLNVTVNLKPNDGNKVYPFY